MQHDWRRMRDIHMHANDANVVDARILGMNDRMAMASGARQTLIASTCRPDLQTPDISLPK